ncbi:uncharacterized protein [Setaria viridis]|uniref:Uncharacterized protein n=1 Tax=Setaria viridis TaxID=4556 RepID=A0A4U6UXF2_SETVI|nr:uncharacterized protein LOC117853129 [Setaria viridis]TKW20215.1 hypothetical protein SEVIR_4G071400v2 [Setaria viridis]
MICFGQIAQRIIGKSVDLVIRTIRRDEDFPPDIAGIASQKYTFAITMTNQSYYTRNKSYMVNSIIASYGRQRAIPQVGASSSNRQSAYRRGSAASTSTENALSYTQTNATLSLQTPPSSPAIFRTTDKDAPSPHLTDTPENNSARKRLYLTILLKMDRNLIRNKKKRKLDKQEITGGSAKHLIQLLKDLHLRMERKLNRKVQNARLLAFTHTHTQKKKSFATISTAFGMTFAHQLPRLCHVASC